MLDCVCSHVFIAYINGRIIVLIKAFSDPKLVFVIGCLLLFLLIETSATHIAIYDGYIIQRSYFVREEKIKISEIKDCKITTGRKRGEAIVNLKVIGNKKGDVMNINMVAYKNQSIIKITELIGYSKIIRVNRKDEK